MPPLRPFPRTSSAIISSYHEGASLDVRCIAYLRVWCAHGSCRELDETLQSLTFPEPRDIAWNASQPSREGVGCGFSHQVDLPSWAWALSDVVVADTGDAGGAAVLDVSCAVTCGAKEEPAALAAWLLERLREEGRLRAEVVLIASCPRLPQLGVQGLADLTVPCGDSSAAAQMLRHAGMLVMRSAVCAADVGLLVALCRRRVDALEAKLLAEGHTSGLGGGDFSYAEVRRRPLRPLRSLDPVPTLSLVLTLRPTPPMSKVASRGRHRWDQLLFAPANGADVPYAEGGPGTSTRSSAP